MNRFVIIPTKKPNDQLNRLAGIIIDSGWYPLVLVYAEHENDVEIAPQHVMVKVGDTFNSWVNAALDLLCDIDDDPLVVIMNDDIDIPRGALNPLFHAVADADIAYMSGRGEMVTPAPLEPHLFAVRANTVRLPDVPGLALWWWNTDHLYHQSCVEGKRLAVVGVLPYVHRSPNGQSDGTWRYPAEFQWSVQADHDWFWERWWHLDTEHRGCYLRWWPNAVPEGQTHRTEWP